MHFPKGRISSHLSILQGVYLKKYQEENNDHYQLATLEWVKKLESCQTESGVGENPYHF
jgi:hypothetical protein